MVLCVQQCVLFIWFHRIHIITQGLIYKSGAVIPQRGFWWASREKNWWNAKKQSKTYACLLNKSKPKCHHAEFIMIDIIIIIIIHIIIHFTSAQVAEICSEMHWRTRVWVWARCVRWSRKVECLILVFYQMVHKWNPVVTNETQHTKLMWSFRLDS